MCQGLHAKENSDVFRGQRESQWGGERKGSTKGDEVRGWQEHNQEGHSGLRKECDFVSRAMEGPLKGIQQGASSESPITGGIQESTG